MSTSDSAGTRTLGTSMPKTRGPTVPWYPWLEESSWGRVSVTHRTRPSATPRSMSSWRTTCCTTSPARRVAAVAMPLAVRSILGQRSEVALGLLVPPHAPNGASPPAPHVLERRLVRDVTSGDDVLQVSILGLDDFVGRLPMEFEITRSAQLLAGHCLHR